MGVIFWNWLNTMNIQAVKKLTSSVLITRFSKKEKKNMADNKIEVDS